MKHFLVLLSLLAAPLAVNAERIQSTTGVYLTFRHCISGETACDSIGPTEISRSGGLPGESAASARHAEAAYGEAGASAQLTGPGAARLSANATSLSGTRNGGSSVALQRYTNTNAHAETLTFSATLSYDQTVPAENAGFPDGGPGRSGAFAEMAILSMNVDALEAGTTAEENVSLLLEGPDPGVVSETVEGEASARPSLNETGSGTTTFSSTATVKPGDSVWLLAILQSLAANGAVVNAALSTTLEAAAAD